MSADPQQPRPGDAWRRIAGALWSRPGRAQVAVAALCGLLAFALVTQAHSNAGTGGLTSARSDDLLTILADLSGRADRLRSQVGALQDTESRLQGGSAGTSAALAEARARAQTLAILTGTVAARGPGVVLTVTDPRGSVRADELVDAIEELRDAGAEAMQLSGVRVVASTAVVDAPGGGVRVDGTLVRAPYRLVVIGDPKTLASALAIPGGVVDTISGLPGAGAIVTTSPSVTVSALRALTAPRYARPAPTNSP
ncbi:MAG TPA: DUF881 domain-containing protein [Mycobacteriales bacterium]|nr:DUF881 domain-containing protein [Mycobacteriales bacterium]